MVYSYQRLLAFPSSELSPGVVGSLLWQPKPYGIADERAGPAFAGEPSGFSFDAFEAGAVREALLEREHPGISSLSRFARCVETATIDMFVAFDRGGVRDFVVDNRDRPGDGGSRTWIATFVDTTFWRFRVLRRALMYDWDPPVVSAPFAYSAFRSLCDLTPAVGPELRIMFLAHRSQAVKALVDQLDLIAHVIEETVSPSEASIAAKEGEARGPADGSLLRENQAAVLGSAGRALGLREAAGVLNMSHQNLHKRIGSRSAIGVMQGRELVVPDFQFVAGPDGTRRIVPGLKDVLDMFAEASGGGWSAIQFLARHDPLLNRTPMDALKDGDVSGVVEAARAHLGLDEQ